MAEAGAELLASTASLWDWRRRVADLFVQVRATPDPHEAWQLWKDTKADLFAHHAQTPLERGAALPIYFDYDPGLRFAVELGAAETHEPLFLSAGADGDAALTPFATTHGLRERFGGELTLYWLGGYGGGVFLPFRDGTSGHETYGGGRYLIDSIKSADLGTTPDGRIILDFNFAYNPSCYYSPRWVCPLAPRNNWLSEPARGGEMVVGH